MQVGMLTDRDGFKTCKIEVIRAAKDFRYGRDVIERLEKAETESEIERIMVTARHEKFKD